MRIRSILTIVLATFIVAAVATIAMQSTPREPAAPEAIVSTTAPDVERESAVDEPVAAEIVSAETVEDQVDDTAIQAEASPEPSPEPAREIGRIDVPQPPAPAPVATVAAPAPLPVQKIVATYFHGNVRCTTCQKVESYAREAVESGFEDEVDEGLVEFRAVNVEEPANRHFIQDYQLVNRSVVVTEEIDGVVNRYVKLDGVWALVGNHDHYLAYVQDAVRGYLETRP